MQKELGLLIIEKRKYKNLSQIDLANALHVSRQAVSNWEKGKNLPDVSLLFDLSKILDIDIHDLFKYYQNNNIDETDLKKARKKIRIRSLIIILIILLVSSFAILALYNNNRFVVYEVNILSEEFSIENSIIIKSKIKNYYQIGRIIPKDESKDIFRVKVYTIVDGKEDLIIETTNVEDAYVMEDYGYNEYFADLNDDFSKLFIEITTLENGEIKSFVYPLKLSLVMKNKMFFHFGTTQVGIKTQKDELVEFDEQAIIDGLLKNDYVYNEKDSQYYKKDGAFAFSLSSMTLMYSNEENGIETTIYYSIDSPEKNVTANIFDNSEKEFIKVFNYSVAYDTLLCDSDNCDDYELLVKMMLDEAENIGAS